MIEGADHEEKGRILCHAIFYAPSVISINSVSSDYR